MKKLRKHIRQHGSLEIEAWAETTERPEGPIDTVILRRPENTEAFVLTADELYRLIDVAGVIDPDTWAKRFPCECSECDHHGNERNMAQIKELLQVQTRS